MLSSRLKEGMAWLGALAFIVTGVVGVGSYVDARGDERFYDKERGVVLEQRVDEVERRLDRIDEKLGRIEAQQSLILVELGKLSGKLDAQGRPQARR